LTPRPWRVPGRTKRMTDSFPGCAMNVFQITRVTERNSSLFPLLVGLRAGVTRSAPPTWGRTAAPGIGSLCQLSSLLPSAASSTNPTRDNVSGLPRVTWQRRPGSEPTTGGSPHLPGNEGNGNATSFIALLSHWCLWRRSCRGLPRNGEQIGLLDVPVPPSSLAFGRRSGARSSSRFALSI
jgi:hypothetical protein